MRELIERLYREQTLAPGELRTLLLECRGEDLDFLMQKARAVTQSHFGNRIYIRGLIEIGNCCHNDCFYCGIRKSNRHLKRYRLDAETILACCRHGYELGFRTFVLQGGEDNYMNDDRVTEVVTAIRPNSPMWPSPFHLVNALHFPTNVFFRQVPIAICCATKRTMKHITAACTLKTCRCPTACVV